MARGTKSENAFKNTAMNGFDSSLNFTKQQKLTQVNLHQLAFVKVFFLIIKHVNVCDVVSEKEVCIYSPAIPCHL